MNKLSILTFIAVIPIIFLCIYIYHLDKDKEPLKLLIKLFILGIASCFLVIIISLFLEQVFPFMGKSTKNMSFLEVTIYSFITVGLIEELCKWIMVYFFSYNSKYFDQMYDMVVYAAYVSLGFALVENLFYIIPNGAINLGIIRGLLAVPGHACDAIFMGNYLSLAKLYAKRKNKKLERKNIILSIIIPSILHGIYDFCLFVNNNSLLIVFIAFVTGLYIMSLNKLQEVSQDTREIIP